MSEDCDIFHDVVMSEEIGKQAGFEAGRKMGRQAGIQEGNKLGWEKGSSIGSEVGFYAGFAGCLLERLQTDETTKPRILKALTRMTTLVNEFPLTEPLNPDLHTKLEEIRTKFKQVCSVLGIKPEVPSSGATSGISF